MRWLSNGDCAEFLQLEMPPNIQFIYFVTSANKEMDTDSLEFLGADRLYAAGGPTAAKIVAIES